MIEVKICGITNPDDARLAAECGANALGFIFHPLSPRYIAPDKARTIMTRLPGDLVRVGVFVNQRAAEIRAISQCCGLHLIQLHGDESPAFCRQFEPGRVIKALAPRNAGDLEALPDYRVHAVLIDARRPGLYGGTGEKADWGLAREAGKIHPLILAGGLGIDNVARAIRDLAPRALDLNSGLESSPGKKDPEKVKGVLEIIRSLEPAESRPGSDLLFDPQLASRSGSLRSRETRGFA